MKQAPAQEVWKQVVVWGMLLLPYEVSSEGRVRKLLKDVVRGTSGNRPLKLVPVETGYVRAQLSFRGQTLSRSVHVMVLEAFVGLRGRGQQTRHLNGVRTDNRLSNLAWGTAKENANDRRIHGTSVRGERHRSAKLTEGCVGRIRDLRRIGVPVREVREYFGVSDCAIRAIDSRKSWAWL
jgi:hypothetical protein